MTVPTPPDEDRSAEASMPPAEQPSPSQSFSKGRHMTVHLPAEEDGTPTVEHHDEDEKEYVEPYVPMPTWNKYDRRASGARVETSEAEAEAESEAPATPDGSAGGVEHEPDDRAPSHAHRPTEHVEVDLTDGAAPARATPAESAIDREIREAEERAAIAAVSEPPDPFALEDGRTYWQRHSANLPRLEDEVD